MPAVVLAHEADLDGFKAAARRHLVAGTPPFELVWRTGEVDDLFAPADEPPPPSAATVRVSARLVELARDLVCHADPGRFPLLYRLLWRHHRGERRLLDNQADPDVARALAMARTIRREVHKMHAFVRFKEVADAGGSCWLAWFEPAHHVVDRAAPFFARRFATMRWSILTPSRSAHWDLVRLSFGPGAARSAVPDEDALEGHWRTYFASIFNPARLKPGAMRKEMPERYWKNLPEARLIGPLMAEAGRRVSGMVQATPPAPASRGRVVLGPHADHAPAAPGEPPASLTATRAAAGLCRACPLGQRATGTVFGEGPEDARVMLVGEQPGDQEDLSGRPFVGPAGRLLDRALAEAGLKRPALYLTNVVKHFKFTPRGKRRIHQQPDTSEVTACRVWLDLERAHLRPRLIVALGATATGSLLGRPVRLETVRGRLLPLDDGSTLLATAHPAYLLRLPDPARQAAEHARFIAELRLAVPYVSSC